MGFLKFLKKGKKEKMLDESLDIPPPPPSIKESLPESGFEERLLKEKEFPPFEFKEGKPMPVGEEKLQEWPKEKEHVLEVPGFPPLEEKPRFVPKPPMKEPTEIHLPKKELIPKEEAVGEKIEAVVREERKPLSKGPIYIRLDKFKETLKSVNIIRGDLKKSDEVLHNLIKSKEEKDRDFEKWHNIMDDIQKKLIFIEKTLFKGD